MFNIRFAFFTVLVVSAIAVNAQNNDGFNNFEGRWKHTNLLCRSYDNSQTIKQYSTKLIKSGDDIFYPDVELKFSTENMNLNGQIVPAKNLEKAVTQGSCKLDKSTMSVMNGKGRDNYIWSSNRIEIRPTQKIQDIQYYEMSGVLLDKKVNYSDISDCGRKDNQKLSVKGLVSALFTYYRYEVGNSYFKVEADRKYNMYVSSGVLNLEFYDRDICSQPGERVVMQFNKVN